MDAETRMKRAEKISEKLKASQEMLRRAIETIKDCNLYTTPRQETTVDKWVSVLANIQIEITEFTAEENITHDPTESKAKPNQSVGGKDFFNRP